MLQFCHMSTVCIAAHNWSLFTFNLGAKGEMHEA